MSEERIYGCRVADRRPMNLGILTLGRHTQKVEQPVDVPGGRLSQEYRRLIPHGFPMLSSHRQLRPVGSYVSWRFAGISAVVVLM